MKSSVAGNSLKDKDKKDFLESVFETVVDGIVLIDHSGIILDLNQSALNYFGYAESELLGLNVSVLMGAPHAANHDGYIKRYLETGESRIINKGREVEGRRKDGSTFPFWLGVSEFKFDGHTFFTGVIHDLTAQKAAEKQLKQYAIDLEREVKLRTKDLQAANIRLEREMHKKQLSDLALKESQKLYKKIAQNFPNGTINVFDRDLNYVFVEGKGLKDLGIQTEDLLGLNFLGRIEPGVRETVRSHFDIVFAGSPCTFELNAHNNIYLLRAEPLFNIEGEIEQILVVETNITKRKQAEEDMAKALAKEIELNELKSRFVSMASHEFRTPLSAILSSATLLGKYTESDQQANRDKHINRIRSNVENLNMILEDFLSLEKLNEGKVDFRPHELPLREFMKDCIEETEGILKKGQHIELRNKAGEITIYTDRYILKNILVNLISNASKYSSEGQPIEMEVELTGRFVHIALRDHGIGIPAKDMNNLFGRFFRASNAGNIQGTGLGLHIVKSYVDLIGGSIRCESKVGQGTTMKLKIPVNKLKEHEENTRNRR